MSAPEKQDQETSIGAVAQMGERRNRTAEVRGSIPLGSTNSFGHTAQACVAWFDSPSAPPDSP